MLCHQQRVRFSSLAQHLQYHWHKLWIEEDPILSLGVQREREIKFIGLFENRGHRGPYSPYKPFNHNLYIGIIIFPHIDNPQYTGYDLPKNKANLRDLIAATGLVILLKFDPNHRFFVPCDLEIWWMALENNRAPLLYYIKLCASFQIHRWIQIGITVRKR